MFLKHLLFWKHTLTVNRKKIPLKYRLQMYTCGSFTWSNSIILAEDLIKWKRGFEIFFIDHSAGDIWN